MGDNISTQKVKNFEECLQYIEHVDDKSFGHIDIFRFKQPPYQYIMKFKKTFMEGDHRLPGYMKLINDLSQMDNKNIAKIHACELKQETQMCIKDRKVNVFSNYYNFTLSEAIKKKKILQNRFPQTELIYILTSLLQLALYLKQFNVSIGDYRSESIYITPQGYLKIYLLDIQQSNKHSCYFKALTERSIIQTIILSPQQLQSLNDMTYQIKYDIYKADVFAIGMIIFQLLTLDQFKFYYQEDYKCWKMPRILFDLASMTKVYNQKFITIIRKCLEQTPNLRYSLEQALNQLNILKKTLLSVSYCIRLQDDEENYLKIKPKQNDTLLKSQQVFHAIQRKLRPSPITTLSSTTSSTFRIQRGGGFQNKIKKGSFI